MNKGNEGSPQPALGGSSILYAGWSRSRIPPGKITENRYCLILLTGVNSQQDLE
jgi:hypothetical protein